MRLGWSWIVEPMLLVAVATVGAVGHGGGGCGGGGGVGGVGWGLGGGGGLFVDVDELEVVGDGAGFVAAGHVEPDQPVKGERPNVRVRSRPGAGCGWLVVSGQVDDHQLAGAPIRDVDPALEHGGGAVDGGVGAGNGSRRNQPPTAALLEVGHRHHVVRPGGPDATTWAAVVRPDEVDLPTRAAAPDTPTALSARPDTGSNRTNTPLLGVWRPPGSPPANNGNRRHAPAPGRGRSGRPSPARTGTGDPAPDANPHTTPFGVITNPCGRPAGTRRRGRPAVSRLSAGDGGHGVLGAGHRERPRRRTPTPAATSSPGVENLTRCDAWKVRLSRPVAPDPTPERSHSPHVPAVHHRRRPDLRRHIRRRDRRQHRPR